MKTHVFTGILLTSLLLTLASCEKLLDIRSESNITGLTYFRNEADFEPYVNGIYLKFREFANYAVYGSLRSEEFALGPNPKLARSAVYTQSLSPVSEAMDYATFYNGIGHCNLLLDKIQSFAFVNEDNKKRLVAETYALRAYFYFYLLRIIGETPLMLDAIYTDQVPLLRRVSKTDVMEQVQADIDASIASFQSMSSFSKTSFPAGKYRFSYAGVQALKADTKLWSAKVLGGGGDDFEAALAAALEVEQSGVGLNTDFGDVIGLRASSNPETILAAFFLREAGAVNYGTEMIAIFNDVGNVINIDSIAYAVSPANGQSGYTMSPESKALFSDADDKRRPHTFVTEQRIDGTLGYTWIVKLPGTRYTDDRVADNDLPVYRLADILLMKAEAYAGLNLTEDAVKELNKVRDRAGTGAYEGPGDKAAVEMEILNERGRELYAENKRWYDLVRFHSAGTIDIYAYVPNLVGKTTPLYWPISASVLGKNSKLTQTEGY